MTVHKLTVCRSSIDVTSRFHSLTPSGSSARYGESKFAVSGVGMELVNTAQDDLRPRGIGARVFHLEVFLEIQR